MKTLLEELKTLNMLTGEEHDKKCREIAAKWTSPNDRKIISEWLENSIAGVEADIEAVGQRLDEISEMKKKVKEITEVVSLKYIAQNYFGKSASWLSQRINGNSVRGHVYRLKPAEIETFNSALRDIGMKIGSMQLS